MVNMTAVSRLCRVMSSFKIRCWARQGRSLKESGMAAWLGKPDADTAPPVVDGVGRVEEEEGWVVDCREWA